MENANFWSYLNAEKYSVIVALILGFLCPCIMWILGKIYCAYGNIIKSELSGMWEAVIYDASGNTVVKRDLMRLVHNEKSNSIHGKVNRKYPDYLNHRSWGVQGVCKKDTIACVYWSEQITGSIFCASFHKVDKDRYIGQYFKHGPSSNNVVATKLELTKVRHLRFTDCIKLLVAARHP